MRYDLSSGARRFFSCCLLVFCSRFAGAQDSYTFHHENVLGTSLELRVNTAALVAAQQTEQNVLAEIERLSAIFSTYVADSEFIRWQHLPIGRPAAVSPELLQTLEACDRWRAFTDGAFEPGVDELTRLWTLAAANQRLPLDADLAAAVQTASRPHWQLDTARGLAIRESNCPLTLNAIAKGEIIDRACEAGLAVPGVTGLTVCIGGDLRVCGDMTRPVDIADPRHGAENETPAARLLLRDQALATSGGYRRGFDIAGRHYSHLLDPRTGRPVEHIISASVLAPCAADADALATAFSVLQPEESIALAEKLPDVECLLIVRDGTVHSSDGWPPSVSAAPQFVALPTTGAASNDKSVEPDTVWNGGMELAIDFEINQPGRGSFRRPYVAIWIEDKDGFPVRTLTLWVQSGGERWLNELRRWYKNDRMRKLVEETNLVATISGATRKPGKYNVVWDGTDNAGQLVKPGEYTVCIEAAREHGTYQLMRKKINFDDQPQKFQLEGNTEIKGATLDYRRHEFDSRR